MRTQERSHTRTSTWVLALATAVAVASAGRVAAVERKEPGAPRDGELKVSPAYLRLEATEPDNRHDVRFTVTDGRGLDVKGADVTLTLSGESGSPKPWLAFFVALAPLGKQLHWNVVGTTASITVKTGDDGSASIVVWLDAANLGQLPPDGLIEMLVTTTVDKKRREVPLPVRVTALRSPPGSPEVR